jgi:DmsE family decaheme c-type cytochrome
MKRFVLCMALIALLSGMMTTGYAHAASGKKQAAVASKVVAQDPAEFVGSEVCATCHAEVAKKFESNPHSKMALMHGNTGATCENCHGGGKAHVESGGDVTKIKQISKMSPKQVDQTCLGCHASTHPNFERSPHAKAGVGCTSCHSVHAGDTEAKLLKASQPKLCYQCHADQKAQFSMPIHHKVNEGLLKCTDCHDVHGTFLANNLRSTEDQNQICTKCHTDVRGPFVFEHAPVRAEGCVTCHTPHGTQNPRLLNMPSIATLCNQCHSPLSAGGVHGLDAGSTTVTPCVTCHTMIHGSNASQAFVR